MNDYEAKQEARKEYYKAKAEQARQEADQQHDKADSISSYIPFGQPILVGHHSEKRHRRDLEKIDNSIRKAIDAGKKAEHYEQKAASVGKAGISSDDPDAIVKLQEKLIKLEETREKFKAINKAMRNKDQAKARQQLTDLGLSDRTIDGLYQPDFAGRTGIPDYELTNLGANIRSTKARIEKLKAQATRQPIELTAGDIKIIENREANRLQVFFPGKPDQATRDKLKSAGFRWAPSNGCWQAYINAGSLYNIKKIVGLQ